MWRIACVACFVIGITLLPAVATAQLPTTFDLRDYNGQDYVTSIKSQSGGTCWTHGAMAAIEGNLLMTGVWSANGEAGEPNLAEYHLDWWNGFNTHNNDDTDPPTGGGLTPHEGGDYRVTTAYLSRGEGAVRDVDGQSYEPAPARSDTSWHYYYPRTVEWLTMGADLSGIDVIKQRIMDYGVMGTCMCYDGSFISNYKHYQPPTDLTDPNHAIAIIGWNDTLTTQAPLPGAWLCKNSWGASWGLSGCFWISYYDKHSCRNVEMGAISFQDVEPMQYDRVYYHDYHGWRDTITTITEAFNAFTAVDNENLEAVSFFTAVDNVTFTVKIYDRFEGGELLDELASKTGVVEYSAFHTVDFDTPLDLLAGDDFYVYLELSDGGHPYDRTSDVPVLLGAQYRTIVESSANPGESYYREGGEWLDFYDYENSTWTGTGNFCIKALAKSLPPKLNLSLPNGTPDLLPPGETTTFIVEITDGTETYLEGSGTLHYRYEGETYSEVSLVSIGSNQYEATLPEPSCDHTPEFYISAEGTSKTTICLPAAAPSVVYSAGVGIITTYFLDDFETATGWTATNLGATSGDWERGVPVDDDGCDWDPMSDADGSGQCYLTENQMGNTDIDDGSVRLQSPAFDMSNGGTIAYDYFLYLTDVTGGYDKILVEINDAGGLGTFYEIARHDTHGGLAWRHHEITEQEIVAAGVSLTSNMVVRITANDSNPQSIVEAGIDHFMVYKFHCEDPFMCGDCDKSGSIDIDDAVFLIQYIFSGGSAPDPLSVGDADCSGSVDIDDAVYLIQYIFAGGPPPGDPNNDGTPDC